MGEKQIFLYMGPTTVATIGGKQVHLHRGVTLPLSPEEASKPYWIPVSKSHSPESDKMMRPEASVDKEEADVAQSNPLPKRTNRADGPKQK